MRHPPPIVSVIYGTGVHDLFGSDRDGSEDMDLIPAKTALRAACDRNTRVASIVKFDLSMM